MRVGRGTRFRCTTRVQFLCWCAAAASCACDCAEAAGLRAARFANQPTPALFCLVPRHRFLQKRASVCKLMHAVVPSFNFRAADCFYTSVSPCDPPKIIHKKKKSLDKDTRNNALERHTVVVGLGSAKKLGRKINDKILYDLRARRLGAPPRPRAHGRREHAAEHDLDRVVHEERRAQQPEARVVREDDLHDRNS